MSTTDIIQVTVHQVRQIVRKQWLRTLPDHPLALLKAYYERPKEDRNSQELAALDVARSLRGQALASP